MRYVRKWKCSVCGLNVVYDPEADLISCGCGEVKNAIRDHKMRYKDLLNFRSRE